MNEIVFQRLIDRYGWMFVASSLFWPVYRDFVQGMMIGLLE